jgi:hypothetical protein
MFVINVIIDKSRFSRPPQKKSTYFIYPDFSAPKIKKKCANYVSKYGTLE